MTQTSTAPALYALAPRMDVTAKAKLLAALRSGEYTQARNALRVTTYSDDFDRDATGYSFCCLGVLCDISGMGGWEGDSLFSTFVDGSEGVLPESISKAVGIANNGLIGTFLIQRSGDEANDFTSMETLVNMNDEGFTFAQIADVIEYFL